MHNHLWCFLFRILSHPKVPVWGDGYGYGSCLMDYVPAVGKHLDEIVSNNNIPVCGQIKETDRMYKYN